MLPLFKHLSGGIFLHTPLTAIYKSVAKQWTPSGYGAALFESQIWSPLFL